MRKIIAAAALAAATLGGLAATATPAFASTGTGTNGQTVASASTNAGHKVHVINLQKSRRAILSRGVKLNPSVYTRSNGTTQIRGARKSGCVEPDCNLTYRGGLIQTQPRVILLLWGPDWFGNDPMAVAQHLQLFYDGIGTGGDRWSAITTQYGDSLGNHPVFDGSTDVLLDTYQDTSTPPQGTTAADFLAEATAFDGAIGNRFTNDQVVIATDISTMPDGFPGWCGYHSFAADSTTSSGYGEPYVVLPYIQDAGTGVCGNKSVHPEANFPLDGFTIIAGHEFAETVTDPIPNTGWRDRNINLGEIADKCWPQGPNADLTLATGTFAVQPLWSNAERGCTMRYVAWAQNPVSGLTVSPRYTQADVSWKSAKNARDYREVVKRVSTGATIQNTIVTGTSFTINNLSKNVKYTVNVKARPALPDAATSTVTFTTK